MKTESLILLIGDYFDCKKDLDNHLNAIKHDQFILSAITQKIEHELQSGKHLNFEKETEALSNQLFNTKESASKLKCSVANIYKLISDGKLEGNKPNGKSYVFTHAQIQNYLDGKEASPLRKDQETALDYTTRRNVSSPGKKSKRKKN